MSHDAAVACFCATAGQAPLEAATDSKAQARSFETRGAIVLRYRHLGGLEGFEVHLLHFIA